MPENNFGDSNKVLRHLIASPQIPNVLCEFKPATQ